jgi:hypothetical protein
MPTVLIVGRHPAQRPEPAIVAIGLLAEPLNVWGQEKAPGW